MKKSHIRKLDLMWSKMVRAVGHCESCLEEDAWLEAAHIVGRTYRTTRWGVWIDGKYDSNGMCLCVKCHQDFDQHIEKEKFIREVVIGLERYDRLLQTKRCIAKNQQYEEIRGWLSDSGRAERKCSSDCEKSQAGLPP